MSFLKSIRWRVQIWHSLLLICTVSAFGAFFYVHEKESLIAQTDNDLLSKLPMLLPKIGILSEGHEGRPRRHGKPSHTKHSRKGWGPPPHERDHKPIRQHGPPRGGHETKTRAYEEYKSVFNDPVIFFAAWPSEDSPPVLSENAPKGIALIPGIEIQGVPQIHTRNGRREAYDATPHLSCILVGVDLAHVNNQLNSLAWQIFGVCSVVIIVMVFIGWLLTGIVVKPFQVMKSTAERVAKGDLGARVTECNNLGETSDLANTLNHTFERLELSFGSQRRFIADASHELRSPISALLLQLEVATSKKRSNEEYELLFSGCKNDAESIRLLSEELLNLALLEAEPIAENVETFDISAIISETISQLAPLVDLHHTEIHSDLERVCCEVDSVKIKQVITNLLTNSIIHNSRGTRIDISLSKKNNLCLLLIKDSGQGIPQDQLPNLFERFTRGAKARKERLPGSGLGMAIVKSILDQHGATIKISSEPGAGTKVTISMPC